MGPILNPLDELIEAIAERMGISVDDAAEIVSMVENNVTTNPESASHFSSVDTSDTFFFEGDEPSPTTETTLPVETSVVHSIGRYHELGTLGVGGMGKVYKVLDPSLNRVLALKVIHPNLMEIPALVSRFVEEAQIQANLQHPNIVPIHEIGRLEDNRPYFTMRMVQDDPYSEQIEAVHKASSATQWLPTTNGTTFRDLINVFHQVCVTVAFAHAQGVIHRDLKPDNILIGRFGQVLVVDWGLAKFMGVTHEDEGDVEYFDTRRPQVGRNKTLIGSVAGTPAYMSPEQARGETKEVGLPTDVYALGAILYEILGGRAPFDGKSSAEILEQVRKHGPKDKLLLDKIPPPLRALCQSAMERNQSDRTLSAHALAQGLKDWLEGAEKRDKGLKELEIAREVLADVQRLEIQAAAEWKQASSRIQSEGAESIGGWESWDNNKATQVKIRGLREDHRRALQGALVHAPDLEEAHNALAQLVLIDIVRAHALGNLRAEGVLVQQFTGHLDHLTPLVREKLESQLEIGCADPIAGRRMRQGAIIGRQSQRQSIGEHFGSGDRLITLLGTAGVGKTRLALEVAEDLLDLEYKVIFCDLTEATDAMGVGRRLARAMDVRLRDVDPMAHLCEILAAQRTLLILDNLEQIQTIIGPLVTEWIGNTNHLLILATSRLRLMVESETVVAIQPLALLESVELFVTRGQTADQRFELTPDNRIQVCQIVRQLDGLPLAIELAAARLKLLTLDEIGTHLENRFGLLRSHGKESRALDAALDWSWSLLEPWAKAALSQASLFQGGFNLAAATGVIQNSEFKEAPEIFDVLGGLVDNSLLRLEHSDAGVRYSLLESIRAYANNKLGDPKEGAPSLWGPRALTRAQQNHAAYFSRFGTPTTLRALKGFKSSNQWDELFLELDNLVAAIYYGTPESSPLCCLAALKVLGMKGPVTLGVDIATQVMKMPGLNGRAYRLLEIERGKCLRISGRMGEARSMVHSLPPMQMVSVEAKSDTLDSAQNPLSREAALVEAARLLELGNIEKDESNYAGAEQCYIKALAIFQKYGERADEGEALGNLGIIYRAQNQYDRAVEHYNQALDVAKEIGNKRSEGINLGNLGVIYRSQSQYDQAVEYYSQALDIAREIGNKRSEGINLGNLGDVFFEKGQFDKAEEALRQSIFLSDESCPPAAGAFRASLALLLAQQDQFDEPRALLDVGEPQVVTYPIEHSKFLCKKGQVQFLVGEPGAAQNSLDQAKVLSNEHKFGDNPEVTEAIDELATLFRSSDEPEEPAGDEREDALIEAARLQVLGSIEQEESKYFEAEQCFRRSLEIYLKYRDRHGEASVIGNLGNVYREKGQPDRAVDHYTQAVDIASKIGSQRTEGVHLGNLGGVYLEKGQHDRAVVYYSQAIAISIEIGDKSTEGINLGNLGNTYKVQGLYDRAVEHYKQAIAIGREVGNRRSEGINLGNLGDVFVKMGQLDKASATFRKAISICDQSLPPAAGAFRASLALLLAQKGQLDESQELLKVGEPQVTTYPAEHAKFLSKKGQAQFLTGAPEAAVESHNEANEIADEYKLSDDFEVAQAIEALASLLKSSVTPDPAPDEGREDALIEAARLMELGNIERAENKYNEAEKCYRSAHEIFQKYGERAGEGEAIGQTGAVHREKGQHDRAVENFIQALDIAREIGNKRNESMHLGNLGIVYKIQGQHDRAVAHYKQAIEIAREIGDKRLEGKFLGNLGNTYKARGLHDQAAKHYGQAIEMSKEVGSRVSECTNLGNLGDVLVKMGKLSTAKAAFRKSISIGDETQPAAAGAFRGSLALLLAQQDQIDEAETILRAGEAQVVSYPAEHAKFLCKKGQVQLLAGEPETAKKSLDQAKAVADEHKFGDDGEVAEAIEALTSLLKSSVTPDPAPDEGREDALIEAERLMELGNIERAEYKHSEAERCYRRAIDIFVKHGDRAGEGETIGNLGIVYREQGQYDRAAEHYTQAINIAREIGDKRNEGTHLGNLGIVYREQGQHDRAISHYTKALDIARKIGDKRFVGINLGNLGGVYQEQGQHDRAAEHYMQAIDIAREIGDKGFEGINLGNLGNLYRVQGQHNRAVDHYTQAVDIARAIGDKTSEGIHFGNLGDTQSRLNRLEEAEDAFRKSILISDEACPSAAGAFRGSLALLLAQRGQLDEALALLDTGESQVATYPSEYAKFLCKTGQVQLLAGAPEAAQKALDQAKVIATEHQFGDESEVAQAIVELTALLGPLDDPASRADEERDDALIEAARLVELGNIEGAEGKYAEAESCFLSALKIYQKYGDRADEGAAIGNLGNVYQSKGELNRAAEHFNQAIKIAQKVGNNKSEGIHLGNLGLVYQKQGQHDRAVEHFTRAINIASQIGNKRNESLNRGNLGCSYREQGQYGQAVEHYTQALNIAREIGDKRTEGIHVGNLGYLYVKMQQLNEAEDSFRKAILICDEACPPAAGAFRASLALLLAQKDQLDEAQILLKIGEPQVTTYPTEHAKFLCKQGKVQILAGEPEAAKKFLDQAKVIATEHSLGDDGEVAGAINDLADLLNSSGEPEDDEREDALIEAERLMELGRLEEAESKYSQAKKCYHSALAIFQKYGDRAGEGEAIGNLGFTYRVQGQNDDAVEHFIQALYISREVGDKRFEGIHLGKLGIIYQERGQQDQAVEHYNQALDIAREIGDKRNVGIHLGNLGSVYREKGQHDQAVEHFTEAMNIAIEIGDKHYEGVNLGNLGAGYQAQGQYDRAASYYNQAIQIARQTGNQRNEGIYLGNLGIVYRGQGQYHRAVEHYNLAIDIVRETGDKRSESNNLGNLGAVYQDQGQYDRAAEHLTQAIDIAREIGDKRFEGLHLGNLGDVFVKIAQFDKAEEAFRKSILITPKTFPVAIGAFCGSLALLLAQKEQFDEAHTLLETGGLQVAKHPLENTKFLCKKGQVQLLAGEPEAAEQSLDQAKSLAAKHKFGADGEVAEAIAELTALLGSSDDPDEEREDALIEAERLMELGVVERTESNYSEAEQCFLSAIELFRKHNDRAGEGEAIGFLGTCYQQKGDLNRAEELYTQAIEIAQKVGDKAREGHHVGNLGAIYLNKSDLERAVEHCIQAVNIAQEIGDKKGEGNQCGNLGIIYLRKGELDRAAEHLTQAINIAAEYGDKIMGSTHLANLAIIYQQKGELDRAAEYLIQSIDNAREIGDKRNEGIQLGNLGDIRYQQNRLKKAEKLFRKAIPICDEAYPFAAGCFRGSLALLLAQKGQRSEAMELLNVGEVQLLGLPAEYAKLLCKKGQIQIMIGSREAAQESLEQAIAIATENKIENDVEVLQTRHALEALLQSSEELVVLEAEERVDALIEAERLMELGRIAGAESKNPEAEQCYRNALEIFQKHGERAGEGEALGYLGTLYRYTGELERAAEHLNQAIQISREFGYKQAEGVNLGSLALVYHDQGELHDAIKLYTEVIDIAREIGDKVLEGNTLGSLGTVFNSTGDHDSAIDYINQSIDIARQIGDRRREGLNIGNLGLVHLNKAETEQAIALYTQALDIAKEIGDRRNVGNNLGNLGKAYQINGETELAIVHYTQAIDIAREIGNKRGEGLHLGNLGRIMSKQSRFREAEDALRKAITIGEKSLPVSVNVFRNVLVQLLCNKGQAQLQASETKAAQNSLDQAKAVALECKLDSKSESAQAIRELVLLLEPLSAPSDAS